MKGQLYIKYIPVLRTSIVHSGNVWTISKTNLQFTLNLEVDEGIIKAKVDNDSNNLMIMAMILLCHYLVQLFGK